MNLETLIPWFPVVVFLSYIPFLCRMDIRYRMVEYTVWTGMLPMVAATGYLYAVGYYPIECMWLSFSFIALYFGLMKFHIFEGADFTFLMFITLFFVVNPISGRVLMPLVVAEFLVAVVIAIGAFVFFLQQRIERFPMIPLISAAFILAVIFG